MNQSISNPKKQLEPGTNPLFNWLNRHAGLVFILPSVIIVLALSIFPLIISAYLSLSRLKFVQGGLEIKFVGFANFRKLLLGSERKHFRGDLGVLSIWQWLFVALVVALLIYLLSRYIRSQEFKIGGLIYRIVVFSILSWGSYYLMQNLSSDGRPGTVVVTLIYVFVGLFFQYFIGLSLALITTQKLPGRRFFRTIFLLPMMITPVGIGYTFRMLTDTSKGPFKPILRAFGLEEYSWVSDPWGARWAVVIGDVWQWTPFVFIILLAAIEGLPNELFEAAHVDGANRWQIFWNITMPQIIPVSATIILIRMIEAFKIIDLPNVLTFGGPGTATESLTLQSFFNWRTLDVGGSAAIGYMLMFISLFIATSYANLIYQKLRRF
ncbi:MAG: sugar ABC transporter permease [Trueperaceae bacterium]|nr:sugar ABC transporter permease [Trueperaceae bacterium]